LGFDNIKAGNIEINATGAINLNNRRCRKLDD
jgi:hypothetical protein